MSNENLELLHGMTYEFLSRADICREECDEQISQLILNGKHLLLGNNQKALIEHMKIIAEVLLHKNIMVTVSYE
jgi:hypothetical protein